MNRREFLEALAVAAAAGLPLASKQVLAEADPNQIVYDIPRFGNVGVLHFPDCAAHFTRPLFREPSFNIGIGEANGRPPHLVGEALLKKFSIPAASRPAYAFTHLDFNAAARTYGATGGF